MRRGSIHDEIVVSFWKQSTAELFDCIKNNEPNLTTARAVSALLAAGFSSREPAIKGHLSRLKNWAEQSGLNNDGLDESSTGLLGVWLGLCHQQRRLISSQTVRTFRMSVERNLAKAGPLCLGTSVDLMSAVTVGLSTMDAPELWAKIGGQLVLLLEDASAVELGQMIQSWKTAKDTATFPRVDMQHRLESIVSNDQSTLLDKTVGYCAQLDLDELVGSVRIEQEIRFLESLAMMSGPEFTDRGQLLKAYLLFLPYLKNRISFDSLFTSWQRYTDSITKRARLENFIGRYLFCLALLVLISITVLPWVQTLGGKDQVAILSAALTIVMLLTSYTLETIAELHGRQLWEKRKVGMWIGIIGGLIALTSAILPPLMR